jgi:transposase InsO family protein
MARAIVELLGDMLRLAALFLRSASEMRAENLALRKQLAAYIERGIRPRRLDHAGRVSLSVLSRLFSWRHAIVMVRPSTVVRWHRLGWRIFWRWKSRAGRPRIPPELQRLICQMATDNPLWGEERIANELLLKLGIHVSPRTVRKYMPKCPPGVPRGDQRWATFLKNHAKAIIACDFFVAATVSFRMLYVFVVIEHGTRRLTHINVTACPTAGWTLQQLREVIAEDDTYRYLIHDRDSIYSRHADASIEALGLNVLRSPVASPKANSICERVIGTIRRECLDWMIPLTEAHLRTVLNEWMNHYNTGRPHSALGPGVPDPPGQAAELPKSKSRHQLSAGTFVRAKSVLGGLHHEYSLANA